MFWYFAMFFIGLIVGFSLAALLCAAGKESAKERWPWE